MKIAVIGLGSMGKRRIRLLSERADIDIIGIDRNPGRCAEVRERFRVTTCESLEEALEGHAVQCAVISTSPLSHAPLIGRCLRAGLHVFTEINLVPDGYRENMRLAEERGLVLFLSSTFLYRQEIRQIIREVRQAAGSVNYCYHVGQYLPDWHPWEHYGSYFVGDARTNGCREILAIELPWMVSAFGDIRTVRALRGKLTALDIGYCDSYQMLFEHQTGVRGVCCADVVSRKAVRRLEVYGEQLYMRWDGTPDTLCKYDIGTGRERPVQWDEAPEHTAGYAAFVTENPYREELAAFLAQVAGRGSAPEWDFARDLKVLELLDRIEGI